MCSSLQATLNPSPAVPHPSRGWCYHRSLETGRRLFTSMADLSPLPPGTFRSVKELPALSDAEREFLLNKLTPYQRIHALYHCLDRDSNDKSCPPWPLVSATPLGGTVCSWLLLPTY